MNSEDVIRMARQAGVPEYDDDDCEYGTRFDAGIYALERFAELVAAAEREACAKLCEKISAEWAERFPVNADRYVPSDGINDCVASIREMQTNSPQD